MIKAEHSEQNQNGALPCAVRRHQHRHNVNNRYEIIKTLGKGTYGKVKLARNKETNQLVAVKAISKDKVKDSADMRHIRREMEIMSSIRHPHIIQIYEVFENDDKIVIVMEYADGGELYDYLSSKHDPVSEEEARVFFRQIVSAVQYCHEQGIVHRDLKLENILLDKERRIKIADFGLANCFKPDSYLHTFCGSPLYASPEIVCGVPYRGPEVDSWSLGVLLYALLYGSMPFDGRNHQMLVKQITSGVFTKPPKHSVAHELVCWLLTVDPLNRATINDVAAYWWVESDLSAPGRPQRKLESKSIIKNKFLQTVPSRTPSQQSSTPKSILKKVNGILGARPHSEPATPNTAESLADQLAAVCGVNAKDSLTLRTSSAPQKRRMIRCRRDRESGYYSSPERNAYEKVSVSEPTLYMNDIYLQASPHAPLADRSSWPTTGGVYYSNGGCVKQRFTSISSDDGCSVNSQIRPPSAHSDSSFISTDSCDVNSLDAATPAAQLLTPQRPITLSLVPDTLPPLDKKSLDEQAPGSLTPKSEKLVRDLERILAPSGRRRRRKEVRVIDKEYFPPKTSSIINRNLDICPEVAITDT